MDYMMDLKDLLCVELEEYAEQGKMKGKMSAGDLETIHKLTDTVKNIMKINVLAEEMDEGGSSYAGGYEGGSSYARGGGRGRGRNARRDSMGRYASYEGGYSYEGGQGGQSRGNQGGNMGGGSSYARGGRGGGSSSYAGGYSRNGAKDYMMDKIEEMMEEAENGKQREALQKCMQALERA